MSPFEVAYKALSKYLNEHFMGTPNIDHMRRLLHNAYGMRADLNLAISNAEMAFVAEETRLKEQRNDTPSPQPEDLHMGTDPPRA